MEDGGRYHAILEAARAGSLPDGRYRLSQGVTTEDLNKTVLGLERYIRQAAQGLEWPLWAAIYDARLDVLAMLARAHHRGWFEQLRVCEEKALPF